MLKSEFLICDYILGCACCSLVQMFHHYCLKQYLWTLVWLMKIFN